MAKKRSKSEKVDKFAESLKEEETEIGRLEREVEEEEKAITSKHLPDKKNKKIKKLNLFKKPKTIPSKSEGEEEKFSKSLKEDEDEIKKLEEGIKDKREVKNIPSRKLNKKKKITSQKKNEEERKFTESLKENEDEITELEKDITIRNEKKSGKKERKPEIIKENNKKIKEFPHITLPRISLPKIDVPKINILSKINIKKIKKAILIVLILLIMFSALWVIVDKVPSLVKLMNNNKISNNPIMVYSPGNDPIQPCCDEKQKEDIIEKRLYSYEVIATYLKDKEETELILEQHTALEISCEAIITENNGLCKEIDHEESKVTCTTLTLLKVFSKMNGCEKMDPKDREICIFSQQEYHTNCEQYKNPLLNQMCINKITLKKLDCSNFKDSKKNEILCECFKHE